MRRFNTKYIAREKFCITFASIFETFLPKTKTIYLAPHLKANT